MIASPDKCLSAQIIWQIDVVKRMPHAFEALGWSKTVVFGRPTMSTASNAPSTTENPGQNDERFGRFLAGHRSKHVAQGSVNS
jgi:hypothetical protein